MLVNTILGLSFVSFLSILRIKPKFNNVLVLSLTIAVAVLFYFFVTDWQLGQESVKTLIWDSSRSGDIKIDIVSSMNNYRIIFPFFAITLFALINNLFFRYESNKRRSLAILTLNLFSFIMLISGNNLIQIITFVFVIDILSQLFIKDIYASKRYSIYNLVADMGLFLVMAMLQGKLDTLEIGNITHYYETGRHRDFIMFVVMISLFIKFGFFLFQSYLLDLKNTKFHRLILIPFVSTPMVALVLFMKFYPLLVVSPSFDLCLNIMIVLTILWGFLGAISINNLKEKTVYLNMMFIALIVKLVEAADFVWNIYFSFMLILGFCLNLCLYYVHYYLDRENNLQHIVYVLKQNLPLLKFVMYVYIIVFSALTIPLVKVCDVANLYWICAFLSLFSIASAHLFSQVLSLEFKNETKKIDYRPMVIMFLCLGGSVRLIWLYKDLSYICAGIIMFFVLLLKIYPFRVLSLNSDLNLKMQKMDFFGHLYDLIISRPIKAIGRTLTILFDFMFIEKTVTTMFATLNSFTIRLFRKSARHWAIYYLVNLLIAVLIVIYCFWRENK